MEDPLVICLAYLDLGTGSYLLQMAIAGFLGAMYFFKGKLLQFRDFLRRKKSTKSK